MRMLSRRRDAFCARAIQDPEQLLELANGLQGENEFGYAWRILAKARASGDRPAAWHTAEQWYESSGIRHPRYRGRLDSTWTADDTWGELRKSYSVAEFPRRVEAFMSRAREIAKRAEPCDGIKPCCSQQGEE